MRRNYDSYDDSDDDSLSIAFSSEKDYRHRD